MVGGEVVPVPAAIGGLGQTRAKVDGLDTPICCGCKVAFVNNVATGILADQVVPGPIAKTIWVEKFGAFGVVGMWVCGQSRERLAKEITDCRILERTLVCRDLNHCVLKVGKVGLPCYGNIVVNSTNGDLPHPNSIVGHPRGFFHQGLSDGARQEQIIVPMVGVEVPGGGKGICVARRGISRQIVAPVDSVFVHGHKVAGPRGDRPQGWHGQNPSAREPIGDLYTLPFDVVLAFGKCGKQGCVVGGFGYSLVIYSLSRP